MTYFGLSSPNAVSTLFNTSSNTFDLLHQASEYDAYKTLNTVVTSLRSGIAGASSDAEKSGLQDKLDTIMETLKSSAPTAPSYLSLDEQSQENANSILEKYGLGKNINTTI